VSLVRAATLAATPAVLVDAQSAPDAVHQVCFGDEGVNSASGAMCTCYAGSAEISGENLMSDPRDINRDAK
jgi:hypothetical protein